MNIIIIPISYIHDRNRKKIELSDIPLPQFICLTPNTVQSFLYDTS